MRRRFRFRERLLWLLVVLFLLAQFGMFRQFVMREIARRYPANHDQANFLQQSYLAYEKLLAAGPREGFSEELGNGRPHKAHPPRDTVVLPQHAPEGRQRTDLQTVAVGLMLPFQATILYGIAGPGRVTALSINFFYFALFQIALVATLRRLTGRWSVALIGLGLLLTAMTPFYWQGGIADFRTDFIGFCLFGTFMCLALRCGAFASRRWSVAAGLVGALLVTFRFISLVYLAGILGLLCGYLLWQAHRGQARSRERLGNVLIASSIVAIVAIAAIAPRWQAIRQYYVIGHVTGLEGQIRAREQGVNSLGARLVFYPRSLLENHAGPEILLWGGGGLVLAAGASMLLVQGARRSSTRRGGSPIDGTAWAFVIACLMVPLGALTGDVAKSPVVADIMVAPLLWLFLLSLIALARLGRGMPSPRNVRVALSVFAAALLLDGMRVQANEYSRRTAGGSQREQVQKLLALYDRIADCAQALGWRSPTFAANSNADWAYCRSIEAMSFERHGFALSGDEVLADTLFARPPAEQIERLRRADFIILIRYPTDRPSPLSYPFDQQMRELEPRLRQWCDANLISIAHDRLAEPFNCEVTVYVRPAVSVVGERDGWITRSGSKIVALAESLRRWPAIDFWGRRAGESLPQPPHVSARIMASGRAISTPARLSYEGPEYHFNVHVNAADLLRQELVQIDLAFDSSFTPRQVNGTPDDRDLVIRLPTRGEIHPEQ